MGIYYMYICDKCGYSFKAYEGYGTKGYSASLKDERARALDGKMGEDFCRLAQDPRAVLDISRKFLRCNDCTRYAFEPVDALYIMPEDYDMPQAEEDVTPEDMKQFGTLAVEVGCRCGECGGSMSIMSDELLDVVECPMCGEMMHQALGGFF